MLKISANTEQLTKKRESLELIYGPKWASVLAFVCHCSTDHVRNVFASHRRDNHEILKTADCLISRGDDIPKKVETFLKTVRYGKLRRK